MIAKPLFEFDLFVIFYNVITKLIRFIIIIIVVVVVVHKYNCHLIKLTTTT